MLKIQSEAKSLTIPCIKIPIKAAQPIPTILCRDEVSYLLTGLVINRPGMVWAADITYVRLRQGFAYLVAVIDWYSRKVLSVEAVKHNGCQLLHGGVSGSDKRVWSS
jgi:transposase InsO family protein